MARFISLGEFGVSASSKPLEGRTLCSWGPPDTVVKVVQPRSYLWWDLFEYLLMFAALSAVPVALSIYVSNEHADDVAEKVVDMASLDDYPPLDRVVGNMVKDFIPYGTASVSSSPVMPERRGRFQCWCSWQLWCSPPAYCSW